MKNYLRFGKLLMLALVISSLGFNNPSADPVNLVSNGKSQYVIVIAANASAQELRAANLFQKYVEKISGCRLPITNAITPGNKAVMIREVDGLKFDGYRINTQKDGNIDIEGGRSKGCIYGAIRILDRYLGVHLYSPKFAVIPNSKDLRLPMLSETDSSKNSLRIVFTVDEFSADEDLLDWNRTSNRFPPFADNYYCHTFTHRLLPPDSFYKSHPEYYAYVNGSRVPDQLCMSNPDVLKEVIKQMKKDVPLQPDRLYWSVSQADGPIYCQCDSCKKAIAEEKSIAGPIMRLVNQVAKEFPDKIISTLAYYYSMVPPAITKPADIVQIMYCGGDLAAWGQVAKHIYVWDYVVDYFHFQCPYPSLFTVQPQIANQMSKGANEFFIQGTIGYGMEFAELRLYLYSKIAWDPNVDVSATIDEFLKNYYGPAAAPYIRKYIDRMNDAYQKTKEKKQLIINTPPSYYQDTYLSPELLAEYNSFFDQAEKAAKDGDPVYADHVHMARMPLNFAEMEIGKHNMYGPHGWWDATGTVRNKRMDDLFNDFYSTLKKEGITAINENDYKLEDYKTHTLFTMSNEAAVGNLAWKKTVTADKIPPAALHRYYTNDLQMLTDGARGDDATRNLFWLIWPDKEFNVTVDLGSVKKISETELGTSWKSGPTIPPASVECFVSDKENEGYKSIGVMEWHPEQEKTGDSPWRYPFVFKTKTSGRYVRFKIIRYDKAFSGRKKGLPVVTYLDEIEVR